MNRQSTLDKESDMKIKKFAASAGLAAALGLGVLAIGNGAAHGDPKPWPVIPPIPSDGGWLPGDPPGHNPWGPPGQVMKQPGPFYGVPPGHWDDPVSFGMPAVWLPPNVGVTIPLPVVFNPDFSGWGVWVNPGFFVPMPQG